MITFDYEEGRLKYAADAVPGLDPDGLFDRLPNDRWGALVLQVIGQQLSLHAAAAIPGEADLERRSELGCSSATLGDQPLSRIAISDGGVITVARAFFGQR